MDGLYRHAGPAKKKFCEHHNTANLLFFLFFFNIDMLSKRFDISFLLNLLKLIFLIFKLRFALSEM